MSDLNPFDAYPLRREEPAKAERELLLRMQEHFASNPPQGLLARVRRYFENHELEAMLDFDTSRAGRAEAVADVRRRIWYLAPLMFVASVVQGLSHPIHGLAATVVLRVVAVAAVTTGLFAVLLYRSAPRMASGGERAYLKWLERARALPARGREPRLDSGEPSP